MRALIVPSAPRKQVRQSNFSYRGFSVRFIAVYLTLIERFLVDSRMACVEHLLHFIDSEARTSEISLKF
jgi:hypothetical protein